MDKISLGNPVNSVILSTNRPIVLTTAVRYSIPSDKAMRTFHHQ
jgi:hypothetical protein